MSYLSPEQYAILMHPRGIHKDRVLARDGMAYVEAHDIKAEMIRVYGWNRFSWQIKDATLLFERPVKTKKGGDAFQVAYRVHGVLSVAAPDGTHLADYSGAHVGTSIHPDLGEAHGNALANADSYAFKRAALYPLGTQGGLGLYNKGSRDEIVRWTAVKPEGAEGNAADADDAPPVAPESSELPEDPRETNRPPAAPTDAADTDAQRRQTEAMGEPPTELAQPGRWHAHLMGEAMKAKVLDERVESLTSTATVSLKRFLEERMKQYVATQRHAAANAS
jgi:hypothetical protein